MACIHTLKVALSGYCSVKGGGVTASQFDQPSLIPLSVAGCGRPQLGVTHWAASVSLLKVVDN